MQFWSTGVSWDSFFWRYLCVSEHFKDAVVPPLAIYFALIKNHEMYPDPCHSVWPFFNRTNLNKWGPESLLRRPLISASKTPTWIRHEEPLSAANCVQVDVCPGLVAVLVRRSGQNIEVCQEKAYQPCSRHPKQSLPKRQQHIPWLFLRAWRC